MILLPKRDEKIKVAASTKDMVTQPTTIFLTNLQTKVRTKHPVYDISDDERTAIYVFYVVGQLDPPLSRTTRLKLADGMYAYELGDEIGLLQIGIPALDKTTYGNNPTDKVYYN